MCDTSLSNRKKRKGKKLAIRIEPTNFSGCMPENIPPILIQKDNKCLLHAIQNADAPKAQFF